MTAEPEERPAAPLSALRALLLLGVVIGFFAAGETAIALFAAVVWLFLVILYGRRA
jgi:hypothetical protein